MLTIRSRPKNGRRMAPSVGISTKAHFGRNGMSQHSFRLALPFGHFTDVATGPTSRSLIGTGLEKLTNPQASGVTSGTTCGKNVVGADRLITVCDGRLFSNE